MSHQLQTSLQSKTYLGLILAQFTATFNDQAIHMVAVFYAADMLVRFARLPHVDEKAIVSIVTACFITPFLLFSSFAGMLGDKYSKRTAIVFWKVAEVGMMGLALFGLALPHLVGVESPHIHLVAIWSSVLVVVAVFLMGMHSTFFVPAKLGIMPEIMHPSILSRANGILEATSFMAQILGTAFGGMLYALLKGEVIPGNPPRLELGQEWAIGLVLLVLSLIGTGTALLMQPIPAAAPDRPLTWNWWTPLRENIGIVLGSKPLTLSCVGIAFCVFMTLFLRQTLLLQGEMVKELNQARSELAVLEGHQKVVNPEAEEEAELRGWLPPRLVAALREPELRVSMLFVLVGLGIGAGSLAAGFLSGHRIELGMVPVGGVTIIFCTLLPGLTLESPRLFACCLLGIGFGAGFYLVPLYTLLQQRAPKKSKGNVIAASNFINVSGGVVSVLVFFVVAGILDRMYGVRLKEADAMENMEMLKLRIDELKNQFVIPRWLYLSATLFTTVALLLLLRRLPDFLFRSAIWVHAWGHNRLRLVALERLPLDGPAVLLTNCDTFQSVLDLTAGLDRHANVIVVAPRSNWSGNSLLRWLGMRSGVTFIDLNATEPEILAATEMAAQTLEQGGMLALNTGDVAGAGTSLRLLEKLRQGPQAVWMPIFASRGAGSQHDPGRHPRVVFGEPISADSSLAEIRQRIAALQDNQPSETAVPAPVAAGH